MTEPSFVAPPSLRAAFPGAGTARRKFTAFQVPAFLEKLCEVINAKLPATATLVKEGPYRLTIQVEIHPPALPDTGPEGDGESDSGRDA